MVAPMELTPIDNHSSVLTFSLSLGRLLGIFDIPRRPIIPYIRAQLIRNFNWFINTSIILGCIADFFINIYDIGEVSYNLGYILPMIATTLKIFVVWTKQKTLFKLLNRVHNPIKKIKYSSDLGVIMQIREAMTYQVMDLSIFIFAGVCVVIACLAQYQLAMRTRILPIRCVFPFDETPTVLFHIIFFFENWGLAIQDLWTYIHDPSVMGMIRWINIQLSVLQANFEHCDDKNPRGTFAMSEENYNIGKNYKYSKLTDEMLKIKSYIPFTEKEVNVENDSFVKRFKTCVFHHRRLINIVDDCNDVFGLIFLAQIASDCLLICIGLFQMALGIKRGRNVFRDVIMLLTGLSHLGYWSIYGNFLIKEHDALQKSIYACGWENNLEKKNKQIIMVGILQGMQPMVVKAGYFFVFSMETYLSIVQSSYSYFAILNTISDEK